MELKFLIMKDKYKSKATGNKSIYTYKPVESNKFYFLFSFDNI